jgi:hypothetical protein
MLSNFLFENYLNQVLMKNILKNEVKEWRDEKHLWSFGNFHRRSDPSITISLNENPKFGSLDSYIFSTILEDLQGRSPNKNSKTK